MATMTLTINPYDFQKQILDEDLYQRFDSRDDSDPGLFVAGARPTIYCVCFGLVGTVTDISQVVVTYT